MDRPIFRAPEEGRWGITPPPPGDPPSRRVRCTTLQERYCISWSGTPVLLEITQWGSKRSACSRPNVPFNITVDGIHKLS
jgi:hypothetical protein